jgi:hypothetical protein
MADPEEIRRLLDDCEDAEALSRVSLVDLADAYCRYAARLAASEKSIEWKDDPDGWAAELYFELTEPRNRQGGWSPDDERRRREFLRFIADAAPNDAVLSFIGAGPFEDFITDDEDRIRWIEEQALRSAKFRKALANVWVWRLPEEAFLRLERAAGTELAWPQIEPPRPRRTG